MNTTEKGWKQKREQHLKNAYAAVRGNEEPAPLNEAVDTWEMLSEDASTHYFWRALGNFRVNGALELVEDGDQKLLDIDPEVSMAELQEDTEMEPGGKINVKISERQSFRNYGDLEVPEVPLFIPWEHVERHDHEIFPYESGSLRGITTAQKTDAGDKETWLAFYNDEESRETSTALNQVFRGLETSGGDEVLSPEDIFTDRNRENYAETIWESEPLRIRQRAADVWNAAVEAVEDELPERRQQYEDRWESEIETMDALKREFRLMVGDEEYEEENPTYIEEIVEKYYGDGLDRNSPVLNPYLERIESTPTQEGDMNYGEAVRDSETSEAKKERNQAYMSHFLDLVWQMSEEKYGE